MSPLNQRRILLVEDEGLVAMLTEEILVELGCEVTASAASVREAIRVIEAGGPFDLALLDVNLRGETVYPVAEALLLRGVPFVFTTGYGADGVRGDLQHYPAVTKPFGMRELEQALLAALGTAV